MVYRVEFLEGGAIEIEVKCKKISKVIYFDGQFLIGTTVERHDERKIKYFMGYIVQSSVKDFKKILNQIREDELYFSYGKNLLEAEKERKTQKMLKYQRECTEKINQMQEKMRQMINLMQEEINEFTFT